MRCDRNKWLCLICGPQGGVVKAEPWSRRRVMTGVASYRSQRDPASQRSATILLFRSLSLPTLLHRSAEQPQHFFKSVLLIKAVFRLKLEMLCHTAFAPLRLVLSRSGPGIREGRRILAGDQQVGKTGWNHQLPGKISQPGRSGERWVNRHVLIRVRSC